MLTFSKPKFLTWCVLQTNAAYAEELQRIQSRKAPGGAPGGLGGGGAPLAPGSGLRRQGSHSSLSEPVLQPLPRKTSFGERLPSPNEDGGRCGRRGQIESARLKDENVNLGAEVTKAHAAVNAHQRFQIRATDAHTTLRQGVADKEKQVRDLEKTNERIQTELEQYKLAASKEAASRKEAMAQMQSRIDDIQEQLHEERREHSQQIIVHRREVQQAKAAAEAARASGQVESIPNPTIVVKAVAKPAVPERASETATETREESSAGAEEEEKVAAFEKQVQDLKSKLASLNQEAKMKDRQLSNLRTEVDRLNESSAESDGGLAEVMEEELSMMKASYEKKIQNVQEEMERLVVTQASAKRVWEKDQEETKYIILDLEMRLERARQQPPN